MKGRQQDTPINILLAEDDKDDRFFFEKALKEITIPANFNMVNNGEELMEYLDKNIEHLPDILFLDLSMPRKTGFECLIEIKGNIKLKDIHVVVFSTSFSRDTIYETGLSNELLKIRAQNYIRKPSDFAQLKNIIELSLTKLLDIDASNEFEIK